MSRPEFRERLASRATLAGLAVAGGAITALDAYFELLRQWNRRISLTSLPLDDVSDAMLDRLFIEPMAAARALPPNACVVDVGSGGGSPAIPLKIMVPGISLVMIESRSKKAAFLREVVRQLALPNTAVEAVRLEELVEGQKYFSSADIVTARAVRMDLPLLTSIKGLLKPRGAIYLFTRPAATIPVEGFVDELPIPLAGSTVLRILRAQ